MDLAVALLCGQGYNPDAPENVEVFVADSVEDVDMLEAELKDEAADENDIRVLLMTLLCE